ncbi:hypothetical protein [Streptomyces sp. NPDC085540]|uniref:hypothetical protein n=1 Tax=Streptomyces sp. NPDC085540 TaxID=3365730 RepID=UPI0037D03804
MSTTVFGDSPYEVLGLEIGASDADVRAAYQREMRSLIRDRDLRDRISRAYNALRRPAGRHEADLLTPLHLRLPPDEGGAPLLAEARQRMAEVAPLLPDPASLGVRPG